MDVKEAESDIQKHLLVLQVIWGAFLASTVVYAGVTVLAANLLDQAIRNSLGFLTVPILVASAGVLVITERLHNRFFNRSVEEAYASVADFFDAYRKILLVTLAGRELLGIFGIALSVITAKAVWGLPLCALGFLSILRIRPRDGRVTVASQTTG